MQCFWKIILFVVSSLINKEKTQSIAYASVDRTIIKRNIQSFIEEFSFRLETVK